MHSAEITQWATGPLGAVGADVIGWVTFAAYLAAAGLCLRAARSPHATVDEPLRRQRALLWVLLAVALIALGLNKPLDLHQWITRIGKRIALRDGWYDHRREVQRVFVAYLSIGACVALGGFALAFRRVLKRQGLALAGIVFLVCFILLRTVSFHNIDHLLAKRLAGLKLHIILELAGIACIAASAALDTARGAREETC